MSFDVLSLTILVSEICYTSHLPQRILDKNMTDNMKSASYHDPFEEIDWNIWLMTKLYDKVNITFIWGNITWAPAYGAFIHNSYVMQRIAESTRTFCTVMDCLQLGFWNRSFLQSFYVGHKLVERNFWNPYLQSSSCSF